MLTVAQAAERAGVCGSVVRAWVRDGQLACYRLGVKGKRGKIAITEADLDELLAGFRVGARAGPARQARPKGRTLKHLDIE